MFHPSLGMLARPSGALGIDWNPLLNGNHAMTLVVLAATWKQISYNFLFFLAGLQAIPQQRDRGGGDRRRAAVAPLLDHHLPAALADDVLPARRQHRLRLLRHLRHHRRRDRRRSRRADRDAGLQGLCRRPARRRSRRLGGAVGDPDDHRDRADRDPVPLRRAQGAPTDGREPPLRRTSSPISILAIGILIVAFPVYLAFVASTCDAATIINGNMPLYAGPIMPSRTTTATLFVGTRGTTREPVGTMMLNSFVMAMGSRSARS